MRPIPAHLGHTRPHIVKDGGLWVCRLQARTRWGYGFNPTKALHEWRRINSPGKPAGAQEAQPTTPPQMAREGTEMRHV